MRPLTIEHQLYSKQLSRIFTAHKRHHQVGLERHESSPLLTTAPLRFLDWFKNLPLHHDLYHVGLVGEERARIKQAAHGC